MDAADRVTFTVEDPSGLDRITTTSYTPDDKPPTVTQSSGTSPGTVTNYTYDPMGNETSQATMSDSSGDPLGWWTLNQPSGTSVNHYSGTGNTATATGVTWSSNGATFTGTSGAQIATSGPVVSTTSSFSVAAWVNVAGDTTQSQTAVAQAATSSSGFFLQYDPSSGD